MKEKKDFRRMMVGGLIGGVSFLLGAVISGQTCDCKGQLLQLREADDKFVAQSMDALEKCGEIVEATGNLDVPTATAKTNELDAISDKMTVSSKERKNLLQKLNIDYE
jgi:hypothetical protein